MQFQESHLILASVLFREARVSQTRGNRVVRELVESGCIDPLKTPTGRHIFTPIEGKVVFETLVNEAA